MAYQIQLAGPDRNGNWHAAGFYNGGYAYHVKRLAEYIADRLPFEGVAVVCTDPVVIPPGEEWTEEKDPWIDIPF